MTGRTLGKPGDTIVNLGLCAAIVLCWLALHVFTLWSLDAPAHPWLAVLCLAGLTWLSVGLFIIAHDAMHGSIVPGRTRMNAAIGQLALWLYAGFSWRKLIAKHMAHHRHAGTDDDPDFDHGGPVRWYGSFVATYFGWREGLLLPVIVTTYALILGDRWIYVVFWPVPAILASIQLFVFGTWLPHRPGHDAFPDRHNARSTGIGDPLSLLTCFHFGGYHHEHHLHPHVPWWRLPRTRKSGGRA
ncbi:fatty acid desaturase [Paracoccus beibuensis]|uniref:fatty acid desaturase n=1 Tax=Paracoccus beibuensis TaxID=547602 RepID=UPI00223FE27C|nr:fatty acid desaturase [Paracoccus beibuensis]